MIVEPLPGHSGVTAVRVDDVVVKRVRLCDAEHRFSLADHGAVYVPGATVHRAHLSDAPEATLVRGWIDGITVAESPALAEHVRALCAWVTANVGSRVPFPAAAVVQKAGEIISRIPSRGIYTEGQSRCVALSARCLAEVAGSMRDATVPGGPYHGDLTLENAIVTPSGCVALIDVRVSPVPSPVSDFAKMLQCVSHGWGNVFDGGALEECCGLVRGAARSAGIDDEVLRVVEWLTVLRVAPYATTPEVAAWCARAAARFM